MDFIRQGTTKPLNDNFNQIPLLANLLEKTPDTFFEDKNVNGNGIINTVHDMLRTSNQFKFFLRCSNVYLHVRNHWSA